jgi:hypothetical protein
MTPGNFNLNMYRGDSYAWRFILWNDAVKVDPVDLADATVAAEIREKPGGLTILVMPCVVTLPNIIDITKEPDMYADCPVKGVWDLQVTFTTSGEVHTPIAGSVSVSPDVTGSTPGSFRK